MTYFASAPLVIVRTSAGSDVYVYGGFVLPDDVDKETVKGLLAEGLIADSKPAKPESK